MLSVSNDLHLCLKLKFQNSEVLGCAVVSCSGQWLGAVGSPGMPCQWSIPEVPDRAHCDMSLCLAPISRLGLRVCIWKIYPVDDISLQSILMANLDCFWGLLGWVSGRGGGTFPAGTGFCCEKQYEISLYACCNQSGMLSNTNHHHSYRAWSILCPNWQRNVEYHPFVGWPDTTVMQALKICVVNQAAKQR